MSEVIRIKDQYYVQSTSPLADQHRRVLKQGETFAVFDHHGDIQQLGLGEQGIYFEGTRFVSRYDLRIGGSRPLLLSSTVKQDNSELIVDLENSDIYNDGAAVAPQGILHVSRSILLWRGRCHECCRITNYGQSEIETEAILEFESDFVDIFEVRGAVRRKRGERLVSETSKKEIVIRYRGLDDALRETLFKFSPQPSKIDETSARFRLKIPSKAHAVIYITVTCSTGHRTGRAPAFPSARTRVAGALSELARGDTRIVSSNEQFNDLINRSFADLRMMVTCTEEGPYPYAGIPWFSTPFGRDGIITALEALWVAPSLAKGVLGYLAANQAEQLDSSSEAEPGKILHERRKGEMAALGEIPFGQYYGSVDSTPLFIVLAGRYYQRSGDAEFIRKIWPNIQRARDWMEKWGDADGDGFVEYHRNGDRGLVNQGWKDSDDCIFHRDGTLARGSIALCEVQGYVYEAKRQAAMLARLMEDEEQASALERQARKLREDFERAFWCPDLGCYALALDGDKQPCQVVTSNAGQCLYSGIAGKQHAHRVVKRMLSADMFSGWGIRTTAASEANFNPMSYHNGSIWPHDNAIIARGFSHYGFGSEATNILTGLFDASLFVDLSRLPELFCGFPRRPNSGPTLYPVACAPQAWAAAAVFMLLEACLNLEINAPAHEVCFRHPILPNWLSSVTIENLQVGEASVDFHLHRYHDDVGINILRRKGHVEVINIR